MSNEELVAEIQAGAPERMGELWEQVAGLVKWKANHIMTALDLRGSPCGVEFEDLYQSGYVAMVEAVHYYNPESGVAFSTCLINRLKTVFAEATGYRTKRGQNEPLNNSFSLDKTMDDESDGTPFGEFVPDPKAAATMLSIEEKLWQKQLREAVGSAMSTVPERYREIIHLRYWENMTLEEVGDLRGISKERVRTMENKGLRVLRRPETASRLYAFVDFNFYCGTGLGAFQQDGMSIQERYLVINEERKERENQRRREREGQKWEKRIHEECQNFSDQAADYVSARVVRMTPEEKQALLERYGYA